MSEQKTGGPLAGVRVVEFAGIGPAPFCGMLLSDLGAEVLLIDRAGQPTVARDAVTCRGRHHLALDLKNPQSVEQVLAIVGQADMIIEGFRPGVMERLGLGPDVLRGINPRLVYGRMTGWGQTGPYSQMAGHDLNYIATSGALHAIGRADRPIPPLNLVGDFGGGALYLAVGLLAALHHAKQTGEGQVVDAAICDGALSLMSMMYGYLNDGRWTDSRESNRLDGAAHYYDVYECADGKWISIASIEPQFYGRLMALLEIADPEFRDQADPALWPKLKANLAARFKAEPQSHWCALFEGTDVCFAPVLSMEEAPHGVHNKAREAFVEHAGMMQPAPAPRFERTPSAIQASQTDPLAVQALLERWGV
ncbi:Alpha-methylacyl-CoA racemase [Sphingobium chlorophenolicum L-1]|uniref:Alpha-methylacyl-CoA racemase n=1 Tax=Sphingobium chlorophenolicum L-1 TaxID=690566 RepID=F6F1J3_SPHCR|nr:CaiB/BaiF CoA-transferase family protein [Sphingobium chlorophenolicum]AEG51409.1 Alpha-methylacyl-CoA racemase [Sphingobium chlorophenolicum L-1]